MNNSYFILLIGFILMALTSLKAQTIKEVTSTDVHTMLEKNQKWVVLDVRTSGEYTSGHIKGAVNIDVHQPDAMERINKLDKNANYIVYCRTRNRSGVVTNYMIKNGFKNVHQMIDGIIGWNQNKLQLTQ